jgi:hypothetical protein
MSLNLQESRRKFLTVFLTEGSAFLTAFAMLMRIPLKLVSEITLVIVTNFGEFSVSWDLGTSK